MKAWKYYMVSFNTYSFAEDDPRLVKSINDLGEQGWEAVGLMPTINNGWTRILFKKPIDNPTAMK